MNNQGLYKNGEEAKEIIIKITENETAKGSWNIWSGFLPTSLPFPKSYIWTCLSREKDQEGEAQILVTGFSRTGNGWTPWCEVIYVKWGDQKTHYGSSNGKLCIERISASVDPPSTVFSLWTFSWKGLLSLEMRYLVCENKAELTANKPLIPMVVLVSLHSQESSPHHFCQISPPGLNLNVVVIWEAVCKTFWLLFCILQGGGKRPRLQCPLVSLKGIWVHVHIQYLRQNITHMHVIVIIRDANMNILLTPKGDSELNTDVNFCSLLEKLLIKV